MDLTGKRFGKLVVQEKIIVPQRRGSYWKCLCNCGKSTQVAQGNLINGHTTSCGCAKGALKDLTGKRFGKLTVLKRVLPNTPYKRLRWECRCDCGGFRVLPANYLNERQSCGCANPRRFQDLVGQRFGRLVVLKQLPTGESGQLRWQCLCDCGKSTEVVGNNLKSGNTTSCGCFGLEQTCAGNTRKFLKRGHVPDGRWVTETAEYRLWAGARYRAKKSGMPFNLEVSDIRIPEFCPITGDPLLKKAIAQGGSANSPSLDRYDPGQGYVEGNVWVVSMTANAWKQNFSVAQLKEFAQRIEPGWAKRPRVVQSLGEPHAAT